MLANVAADIEVIPDLRIPIPLNPRLFCSGRHIFADGKDSDVFSICQIIRNGRYQCPSRYLVKFSLAGIETHNFANTESLTQMVEFMTRIPTHVPPGLDLRFVSDPGDVFSCNSNFIIWFCSGGILKYSSRILVE